MHDGLAPASLPPTVDAAHYAQYDFKEGIDMILDILENAHHYLALHKEFAKAFDFLLRPDLKDLPVGKYEIDADRIYAMVSKEPGRRKEDALLETHERYIDIQLIMAGTDDMGWKPRSLCKKPAGEYDQKDDEQIFMDEPDAWISVKGGAFAIFFPEDAHMPLISSGQIYKVVVKVAVAER
jgi:YhcH/YjgK/YiaL family protein